MSCQIVLYRPEIPQNTGNIGRTCVAAGLRLHLIRPLGFFLDSHHLKRSGMDYWKDLDLRIHDSAEAFREACPGVHVLFDTQGSRPYTDYDYPEDVFLIFGRESTGLPEWWLKTDSPLVRIPMRSHRRSLNLSNAVALAAYEVLRQQNFPGLS